MSCSHIGLRCYACGGEERKGGVRGAGQTSARRTNSPFVAPASKTAAMSSANIVKVENAELWFLQTTVGLQWIRPGDGITLGFFVND